MDTNTWYALRSKPNKELALWKELRARNVESFYPHARIRPVNPRSRTIRPYFPGYLFVQADLEDVGSSAFQWMPFSLGLVSFDGVPAPIPGGLISVIRKHVDELNVSGGGQTKGPSRGDLVVIQDGPFRGYEAIFDMRLSGSDRVRVLLKLIRRHQMPLELPESQVISKKSR